MSFSSDSAKKPSKAHENMTMQLTRNGPYPELMNLMLRMKEAGRQTRQEQVWPRERMSDK